MTLAHKTSRRPKTERVPRTRAGGEWTEAQFRNFLRSGLRGMSRRWPPLVRHVWLCSRRPSRGPNRRQKWEHQCSGCGEWFKRADLHADHIQPCGPLRSWADLPGFAERLFCEADGLRILCEPCHQVRHNVLDGQDQDAVLAEDKDYKIYEALCKFVEAVEREAETNMLKTGKLEGAHYAAMKRLVREWSPERTQTNEATQDDKQYQEFVRLVLNSPSRKPSANNG